MVNRSTGARVMYSTDEESDSEVRQFRTMSQVREIIMDALVHSSAAQGNIMDMRTIGDQLVINLEENAAGDERMVIVTPDSNGRTEEVPANGQIQEPRRTRVNGVTQEHRRTLVNDSTQEPRRTRVNGVTQEPRRTLVNDSTQEPRRTRGWYARRLTRIRDPFQLPKCTVCRRDLRLLNEESVRIYNTSCGHLLCCECANNLLDISRASSTLLRCPICRRSLYNPLHYDRPEIFQLHM